MCLIIRVSFLSFFSINNLTISCVCILFSFLGWNFPTSHVCVFSEWKNSTNKFFNIDWIVLECYFNFSIHFPTYQTTPERGWKESYFENSIFYWFLLSFYSKKLNKKFISSKNEKILSIIFHFTWIWTIDQEIQEKEWDSVREWRMFIYKFQTLLPNFSSKHRSFVIFSNLIILNPNNKQQFPLSHTQNYEQASTQCYIIYFLW